MRHTTRIAAIATALALAASTLVAASPAAAATYTPTYFSPVANGDTIFFAGRTPTQGNELYATDGTAAGTRIVKDLYTGSASAFKGKTTERNGARFTPVGDRTFFAAYGKWGLDLWVTDGSSAGTVKLTNSNVRPESLVAFDGELYFAGHSKAKGMELWKSDGTVAGTAQVADILPGKRSSLPDDLTVVGDSLYFSASAVLNARSIFRFDANGLSAGVEFDTPDDGYRILGPSTAFDGKFVYQLGTQLWESDGTPEGTQLILASVQMYSGSTLTEFDGQLYFLRYVNGYGQLVKIVDSAIVALTAATSNVRNFEIHGGKLWFGENDANIHTSLSSISSADSAPLTVTADLPRDLSFFTLHGAYGNGLLYFAIRDQLWSSDGTTVGTNLIRDLGLSKDRAMYLEIAATDSTVVVGALDLAKKNSFWISDGTTAGTYRQLPAKVFATAPTPNIVGTAAEGEVLTATAGTWKLNPSLLGYQWNANGQPITGATTSTLTVPVLAAGAKVTVSVTASRKGFATTTKTSAAKTYLKAFTSAPTPTISGTIAAGSVLTADPGAWSPAATLSYAWFADGKAIYKGPKTNKYTLTATSQFKAITVRVTATKSGYVTTSRTSVG